MERVQLAEKKVERVVIMSGDFAARRLLIHAFLYYVLDAPAISDGEYDKLSDLVAKKWHEVLPDRQWALGDPHSVRSTGYHFKFSSHCVSAALNYHKYHTGEMLEGYFDDVWKERRDGARYVTTSAPRPKKVK